MEQAFDAYHKWLGIPRSEQPPDHYRLLGIKLFEDDPDVIAAAADRQMGHLRTYQTGRHAHVSQELLNKVAAARVCLLNATQKVDYDRMLRTQLHTDQAQFHGECAVTPPPQAASATTDVRPAPPPLAVRTATRRRTLAAVVGVVATGIVVVLGSFVWFFQSADNPTRQGAATQAAGEGLVPVEEKGHERQSPPHVATRALEPQPIDSVDIAVPEKLRETQPLGLRTGESAELTEAQVQRLGPEAFAEVKVLSGGTFHELKKDAGITKDKRFRWGRIPPYLDNMRFLQNIHKHQGTTKFAVEKPGIVLLAVTSRWGGGGSLSQSQRKLLTTRQRLLDQGWCPLDSIDEVLGKPGEDFGFVWKVFGRVCRRGETFEVRTEKYVAPVIILR